MTEPGVTEVRECICGREFEVVVQYVKPWTVCPACMRGELGVSPKYGKMKP